MRADPGGDTIRFTPGEIAEYYRARLPGLKKESGGEWRAPCPIHQGRNLNFAVNPNTGQWFCHSQCGRGGDLFDLEEALHGGDFLTRKAEIFRLIGRSEPTKPAKPAQGGWREEARYAYTDENGDLLYEVIRYRKPDGSKTFVQVRPSGVERAGTTDPERSSGVPAGGLVIGLDKGKYMPDARASRASGKPTWKRVSDQLDFDGAEYRFRECPRVPYRLPRVLEAETVFLPEGEKDVEMLEGWGLTASCNPGGSGSSHLYARWLDFFRNRHIRHPARQRRAGTEARGGGCRTPSSSRSLFADCRTARVACEGRCYGLEAGWGHTRTVPSAGRRSAATGRPGARRTEGSMGTGRRAHRTAHACPGWRRMAKPRAAGGNAAAGVALRSGTAARGFSRLGGRCC